MQRRDKTISNELHPVSLRLSARSIVSFDGAFDNLGFISNKFRQMLFYIVRSQMHGLISTVLVPKASDGGSLALTSMEPIVACKSHRLINDGHKP